jgi:hypothetical protein
VRHAAGQLADRLHALRLRELRLGMLLLGDVGDDRTDRRDRITRIEQRKLDAEHGPLADRRLDAHLTLQRRLGRDHFGVGLGDLVGAFLRHDVAHRLADLGRDPGADPGLGRAVDERVVAGEVLHKDQNRSVIQDGLELSLIEAQRTIGLVTLPGAQPPDNAAPPARSRARIILVMMRGHVLRRQPAAVPRQPPNIA